MEEKRQTELGTDSVPRSAGAGQSGLSWGAELCAALKYTTWHCVFVVCAAQPDPVRRFVAAAGPARSTNVWINESRRWGGRIGLRGVRARARTRLLKVVH